MLGPLEHLVRLESKEPLDELEPPRQLDERSQLLRKDHPRAVRLSIDPTGAVLDGLEHHPLAEDLRDRIDVVERAERGADDEAAPTSRPRPAPRRVRPRRGHVAIEDVHAAAAE